MAEADWVQAGRLRNPGFSFTRLSRDGADGELVDIERRFVFDLMGLLTLPIKSEIEKRRYEQTRLAVTQQILQTALAARQAWVEAVAAQARVRYLEDVKTAAEAASELARRMAEAGNLSRWEAARRRVFEIETAAQLVRARHEATAARERLTRVLGLAPERANFRLPDHLPDLPQSLPDEREILAKGVGRRYDVQMAQKDLEGLAKSLGLSRATRFVNVLDLVYYRNSATGEPRQTGYEIELSIPLFDWGEARVARAEALYFQAAERLREVAVTAASEIRESHAGARAAFEVAKRYRDDLVPQAKQVLDESLLRYNGMLIGPFELLADARAQIASVVGYLDALRDFWLAEARLKAALKIGTPATGLSPVTLNTAAEGGGKH